MASLEYSSPDWLRPQWLLDASSDLNYRLSVLPYEEDRNADMYIILPSLGVVTPVILIQSWSADYEKMSKWGEIDINSYLVNGVLHYPQTAFPGEEGNMVIFGHSNFFKNKPGKYKTIFADIMNLDVDPSDEIRIYYRQTNGSYVQYRYAITKSYETDPSDVGILLPKWGKEITVFACTNGLEWRRILRGELLEGDNLIIGAELRIRVARAKERFEKLPEDIKISIRDQVFEKIAQKEISANTNIYTTEQLLLKRAGLAYIERALITD